MSRAVDRTPHDMESLRIYLKTRIAHTQQALDRQGWFGGRLWNKIAGDDPEFVWMMGTHLSQVLDLVGIETPIEISQDRQYALDMATAKTALDILSKPTSGANGT